VDCMCIFLFARVDVSSILRSEIPVCGVGSDQFSWIIMPQLSAVL